MLEAPLLGFSMNGYAPVFHVLIACKIEPFLEILELLIYGFFIFRRD